MNRMKACVLKGINDIECMLIEKPEVSAGNVLVKVKACGICSSDLNRVYRTGAYHYPTVLGHEISGEIVEIGEGVSQEYLGKHVVVFPLLPCNECEYCKEGFYAQCKNYNYFGSRCDGGMAEYLNVPLWNINLIQEPVPYEIAALAEPAAVAVHAAKQIEKVHEKSICIIGTGAIGIMIGLYLKKIGAKQIYFRVRNQLKKSFLNQLGFMDIIDDKNEKEASMDVIMECVGSNSAIEQAIKLVKSRGKIILVGNPTEDLHIAQKIYWKILRSEIDVKGVWNSDYKNKDDDWEKTIAFLTSEQDVIKKVITNRFSLSMVKEAFEIMENKKGLAIKGVMINE